MVTFRLAIQVVAATDCGSGGLKFIESGVLLAPTVVKNDPVIRLNLYVEVPSVMLTTNGSDVVTRGSGVIMRLEISLYTPVAPAVKSVCAVVVLKVASCAGESWLRR